MKRIVVTGGNGQLGSCLKKEAELQGLEGFTFIDLEDLDLTSGKAVDDFFSKQGCDLLINCAAYTNVDAAETDCDNARSVNVDAVKNLALASGKYGFKILHISTDYVFPGEGKHPYKEMDLTGPTTVYGTTKLEGEKVLLANAPESIIIRTSWLYSEFGKNFVKTMLDLGAVRDRLTVVADQFGNPTYAGDLASAILSIAEGEWKPGIYHFSNEGFTTWYDFAREIFKISGNNKVKVSPVTSEEYPSRTKRPKYSALDKQKIKDTFGIHIPEWEVSLEKCINKLKKQKN